MIDRRANDKLLAQAIKPEDIITPSKLTTLYPTKNLKTSLEALKNNIQSKKIDYTFQVQVIADSLEGLPQLVLLTINNNAVEKIHIWDPRNSAVKATNKEAIESNFINVLESVSAVFNSVPKRSHCSVTYSSAANKDYEALFQSCIQKAEDRQNKDVKHSSVREELNAILSAQNNSSETYKKLTEAGISVDKIKKQQERFDELYASNLQELEDKRIDVKTHDQSAFNKAFSTFKQEVLADIDLAEKLQKSGLGLFKANSVKPAINCRAEAAIENADIQPSMLVSV